jgi:hypothetical protein
MTGSAGVHNTQASTRGDLTLYKVKASVYAINVLICAEVSARVGIYSCSLAVAAASHIIHKNFLLPNYNYMSETA